MGEKVWPVGRFEDLHYHPENRSILTALSNGNKGIKASLAPLEVNLVEAADYGRKFIDWDKVFRERKEELECSKNPSWKGKLCV